MQPTVTVAIVSAIAALLVAIISLVTTVLGQRIALRATRDTERLRDELTRRREERVQALKPLQESIRVLQRFKDAIQLILEAAPGSLDGQGAVKLLRESREQLAAAFEEHLPGLDKADAVAMHDAKNTAIGIEMYVLRFLPSGADVTSIPPDFVARLQQGRAALTERQQLLRDSLIRRSV